MPDPVRAARTAVRTIESMGVPFDLACRITVDVLAVAAGRIVSDADGDICWIYQVSEAVGELRATPITARHRPAGPMTDALVSKMYHLGYIWSVEYGQFIPDGHEHG